MQNVAWAMMIVHFESGQPSSEKKESMATPVTIPGRTIGRTTKKRMAGLPGKLKRSSAKAVSVPSTTAMLAAISPTSTESRTDSWMSSSTISSRYQSSV